MTFADTFSYYAALVTIAIAPGPMMVLLMTRAASNDVLGAIGFSFGTAIGSLAVLSAVCFGMSVWLSEAPEILNYSKYLMLMYILWIAYGMWNKGLGLEQAQDKSASGFLLSAAAGFITCVSSPYMLVLFPLLLPEVLDVTHIMVPDFMIITSTTFLAEATAAAIMIGLAAQLRRLVQSDRAVLIMNRSLAAILVSVGGVMAFV